MARKIVGTVQDIQIIGGVPQLIIACCVLPDTSLGDQWAAASYQAQISVNNNQTKAQMNTAITAAAQQGALDLTGQQVLAINVFITPLT